MPARRTLLLGAATLCIAAPASGQAPRYAALSLVGNPIEIVTGRAEIGSRLNQNRRRAFDDAEGTLDRYVLRAVERGVQTHQRGASVAMLALPGSVLYDEPERAFDGRQVVLPGAVVDALVASKVSHLLLLTKLRDAARIPLYDETTGVGTVKGIGFYTDPDVRLKVRESGQAAYGVLAPFVYVRISLVDVQSGEVVREERVHDMRTFTAAEKPDASNPWDVLSAEQKIDVLRRLIDQSIGDAVLRLLRAG